MCFSPWEDGGHEHPIALFPSVLFCVHWPASEEEFAPTPGRRLARYVPVGLEVGFSPQSRAAHVDAGRRDCEK